MCYFLYYWTYFKYRCVVYSKRVTWLHISWGDLYSIVVIPYYVRSYCVYGIRIMVIIVPVINFIYFFKSLAIIQRHILLQFVLHVDSSISVDDPYSLIVMLFCIKVYCALIFVPSWYCISSQELVICIVVTTCESCCCQDIPLHSTDSPIVSFFFSDSVFCVHFIIFYHYFPTALALCHHIFVERVVLQA